MPGIAMKSAVVVEFQRQLNHEWAAAHAYMALAAWCESASYKGFAGFFRKQAGEEREHAEKLMSHLLDRGVLPELAALPAPRAKFGSLLEVARHAQGMEQANTAGIHAAYEAALTAKDYPAQVHLQWFIDEQVEEEAWTDELVERIERASCAGALSDLDRHVEKQFDEKVIGAGGSQD